MFNDVATVCSIAKSSGLDCSVNDVSPEKLASIFDDDSLASGYTFLDVSGMLLFAVIVNDIPDLQFIPIKEYGDGSKLCYMQTSDFDFQKPSAGMSVDASVRFLLDQIEFDSQSYLQKLFGDKFKYLPALSIAECKTKDQCDALYFSLEHVLSNS